MLRSVYHIRKARRVCGALHSVGKFQDVHTWALLLFTGTLEDRQETYSSAVRNLERKHRRGCTSCKRFNNLVLYGSYAASPIQTVTIDVFSLYLQEMSLRRVKRSIHSGLLPSVSSYGRQLHRSLAARHKISCGMASTTP